jgi:hypothetical protein
MLGVQDADAVQIVSGMTGRIEVALSRPDSMTEKPKPTVRENDRH